MTSNSLILCSESHPPSPIYLVTWRSKLSLYNLEIEPSVILGTSPVLLPILQPSEAVESSLPLPLPLPPPIFRNLDIKVYPYLEVGTPTYNKQRNLIISAAENIWLFEWSSTKLIRSLPSLKCSILLGSPQLLHLSINIENSHSVKHSAPPPNN